MTKTDVKGINSYFVHTYDPPVLSCGTFVNTDSELAPALRSSLSKSFSLGRYNVHLQEVLLIFYGNTQLLEMQLKLLLLRNINF